MAEGFTFPPKEGVLRILLSLKIPRCRPGLNPQSLGPVASTLAITPPRTTNPVLLVLSSFSLPVVKNGSRESYYKSQGVQNSLTVRYCGAS
jgi:hypothetical protein